MRTSTARFVVSALVGISAVIARPKPAMAEEVQKTYVVKDESTTTGPNRALLRSGIWTLGLAYVPALIVATQSERDADKRLYIPVAGPWLDLASRGRCPANETCNHETTNKVLIAVDGVFQGIGALNIIGAFLFPETRTVTVGAASTSPRGRGGAPSVRVIPARIANAYGLMATGTF
jgi:hypothetical protein